MLKFGDDEGKVPLDAIAEVKKSIGLTMHDTSNAVEELKQPRKHPSFDKVYDVITGGTMGKTIKEAIHAKGIDIGIYTTNFENEFISLIDIAKYCNEDDPRFVIQNWMRNRNTIEFLGVWEELHNPNFNRVQFEAVKNEAGLNRFVMTPIKWITQMNAIGIVSKAGRYGGTYAHSDIALSFATWISPEFQLYIMKDYRRLKTDENSQLSLNWNLNREISKLNYRIHTDAIKDDLTPPELTPAQVVIPMLMKQIC